MDDSSQDEREVRAALNEAIFRAVNDRIRRLHEAFVEITDTFVISCECADGRCIEKLTIGTREYETIRANPRRFAVVPGHVVGAVEVVVHEADEYIVVEKVAAAAEMAEALDPRAD